MFLERSPTLATVGSSGSALSRAGTMGGGGGCTRKQMLGPARSELRIIENHQHDNYATVSGGSLGGGSDHCGRLERGGEATTAGPPVLLQLQDIVRSRQPSQRPSLQSMFSAQGSLLQLESATPVGGGSLQDNSVCGGSSMQNLKQGSGSLDDPSPFSTLKKRKVSQPSPLPPPPSKLVYGSSPKLPQQQNATAAGSPTTDQQQRVGGVPQEAAAVPHSLGISSSAAVASSDSAVSATPAESAANNSSLLPHRSWRGHCFPINNPSIAMTFIFI
jgi:hypothetical protein